MTKELQNIALIEAFPSVLKLVNGFATFYFYLNNEEWIECDDLIECLDAVHEAEKTLTDEQFESYRWMLWDLCKKSEVSAWNRAYLCATAQQRAEALLRTIGKWETNFSFL